MVDLVSAVLGPLVEARGGAQPLIDTLDAYFATGAVATESAKRPHVPCAPSPTGWTALGR
jgi:hypothetical protein